MATTRRAGSSAALGSLVSISGGLVFLMGGAGAAWAQDGPPPNCGQFCGGVTDPGDDGDPGSSDGEAGGSEDSGFLWYAVVAGSADGEPCWTYEVTGPHDTPPPAGRTFEDVQETLAAWDENGAAYDVCPPAETFDPAAAAREAWLGMDVDPATPSVGPGSAITGMRTFLELDGPTGLSRSIDTPLGTLTIEAWPQYRIDWGDGSPETVTTSQGGPYPHGDVTHVYTDTTGEVTITVTTVWNATFRVDAVSASLPTVEEVASLVLPVREIQPVRER